MLESERAVIFQGQGEQYAGMGKKLYDNHPRARAVFQEASEALDMNMGKLCFEDPNGRLQQASAAQPAIVTLSLAQHSVFENEFGIVGHVAGHSLGEYAAAVASGTIEIGDTLKLVRERGQHMEAISTEKPGAMAAVLGLTIDKVREVCERFGVEIASHNTDTQTVISGLRSRVESAAEFVNSIRGKFRLLPIDVASHSSLMEPVRVNLKSQLAGIEVKWPPKIPLISAAIANYVISENELRDGLSNQVSSTVRWNESVKQMIEHGADIFYEMGPGNVLSGLVRRIDPTVDVRNINDLI